MRCGEYVPFGGLPGVGEPQIHRSNNSRTAGVQKVACQGDAARLAGYHSGTCVRHTIHATVHMNSKCGT